MIMVAVLYMLMPMLNGEGNKETPKLRGMCHFIDKFKAIRFQCIASTAPMNCNVGFLLNGTNIAELRSIDDNCLNTLTEGKCQPELCACSCQNFTLNYTLPFENEDFETSCEARFSVSDGNTLYRVEYSQTFVCKIGNQCVPKQNDEKEIVHSSDVDHNITVTHVLVAFLASIGIFALFCVLIFRKDFEIYYVSYKEAVLEGYQKLFTDITDFTESGHLELEEKDNTCLTEEGHQKLQEKDNNYFTEADSDNENNECTGSDFVEIYNTNKDLQAVEKSGQDIGEIGIHELMGLLVRQDDFDPSKKAVFKTGLQELLEKCKKSTNITGKEIFPETEDELQSGVQKDHAEDIKDILVSEKDFKFDSCDQTFEKEKGLEIHETREHEKSPSSQSERHDINDDENLIHSYFNDNIPTDQTEAAPNDESTPVSLSETGNGDDFERKSTANSSSDKIDIKEGLAIGDIYSCNTGMEESSAIADLCLSDTGIQIRHDDDDKEISEPDLIEQRLFSTSFSRSHPSRQPIQKGSFKRQRHTLFQSKSDSLETPELNVSEQSETAADDPPGNTQERQESKEEKKKKTKSKSMLTKFTGLIKGPKED